jgi:hypothetical protein
MIANRTCDDPGTRAKILLHSVYHHYASALPFTQWDFKRFGASVPIYNLRRPSLRKPSETFTTPGPGLPRPASSEISILPQSRSLRPPATIPKHSKKYQNTARAHPHPPTHTHHRTCLRTPLCLLLTDLQHSSLTDSTFGALILHRPSCNQPASSDRGLPQQKEVAVDCDVLDCKLAKNAC